ncbi:UDP-N-acetylglucosamine 2-epimerase [Aequorivita echinoideorum]|uniref:UDP-N-acetylglucosamine 2-epimerase (Hydrolyzing) n=1 Tax=Aequorivita echinoideorum TaxID=1549647 RepID=A0ABS5S7V9_9FLAO|nr:UDP-N-acetylglucosamine 2-epimerase [Aequorivita echinoideorum]MBT0608457.1 UDP-N-acetylglucosamine 2-epimerase (hydrolyzing) [Aequorivita echinoideorum]
MKKIVFLTGTRADFGKIKSLIRILESHAQFEPYVFVTGMHLLEEYGYTVIEVERCGFKNIHTFKNHTDESTMELTLAKTIEGFSDFVKKIEPDLIVVHGDRIETLAGALVGSLNNILVAHIEGGEISGTIDELIRHATSKMSHVHFVANDLAKKRLIQMGEVKDAIFTIGSPDIDSMFSENLPTLETAKKYYEIEFQQYAIAIFHPITTEISQIEKYIQAFTQALVDSDKKYVVIYPNNDLGSKIILNNFKTLASNTHFRIIPSVRFEYFLVLLKNAEFIIGNSSAGIREAPYYGVPTINIGTRQENRALHSQIMNVGYAYDEILDAINVEHQKFPPDIESFGIGNSDKLFLQTLLRNDFWEINHQKQFVTL